MKRLITLLLLTVCFSASAQTYLLNFDTVRVGKNTTSRVNIAGKLYVKDPALVLGGFLYTNTSGRISNKALEIADVSGLSASLAAKQSTLSLTTTGTSGAATLINNVLNIPQYAGGVSGLTNKAITFGKADGTLEQDANYLDYDKTAHSLYVNTTGSTTTPTGAIVFFGNSITAGIGASSNATRWTKIVSNLTGYSESNYGVSSSTLQKRTPIDYGGTVNMVDRQSDIPNKSSSYKYLVFSYAINDWRYNGGSYNTTNFIADFTTILNNALSKGWTGSDILLTSLPYVDLTNIAALAAGGTTPTIATFNDYNAAIQTLVSTFGTKYADIRTPVINQGGMVNMSDVVHPNDLGHYLYGITVAQALMGPVTKDGQKLAINGTAEFSDIKFKSLNLIDDDTGFLLGVGSDNKVGITNAIKANTSHFGAQYFDGNVIQKGASIYPSQLGSRDWAFRTSSKFMGIYDANNSYINSIELIDAGGHMNIKTGYSNATMRFYSGNGGLALTLATNQVMQTASHITIPYGKELGAASGPSYGSIEPFFTTGGTNIRNAHNTGFIGLFNSGGTNGAQVETARFNSSGRMTLQYGGTYTDIPSARLAVNSTTEGFLPPRMTKTQRDAISSPATGLMVYQTDNTPGVRVWNGTNWMRFTETAD